MKTWCSNLTDVVGGDVVGLGVVGETVVGLELGDVVGDFVGLG
jgi:hypothetical protein